MRNPNYARPFILTKATSRVVDTQREAARFTGFVKYDVAEQTKNKWLRRLLDRHTLTGLADKSTYDEKLINRAYNSFGDPEPALNIGPANARQTSNTPRQVPEYAYIGPPQPQAFTDPNFKLRDFILTPANYQLRLPDNYTMPKLTWNLGPEATNANIGLDSRVNGNEKFVMGTFSVQELPTKNYRLQQTKVQSLAVNTQSFFWDNLLVVNTGYREDRVRTRLNTEGKLNGLDEIPDLSPEGFRVEDGNLVKTKSHIFGYGGVLNWPRQLVRIPAWMNVAFHYNTTENFIPATERVDQYRQPIPSPTGLNRDYGVTFFLWENKVVARFNWYSSTLAGASSNVSDLFNAMTRNIFDHFGNLNASLRRADANDDGVLDDPGSAARYPNFEKARAARAAIAPFLTDALKAAYNYRMAADGTSLVQNASTITDTNDVESRGFEIELTVNPTRNWRLAFNAARQETVLTHIAPTLTAQLNTVWLPHLAQYGDLDWNLPAEPVEGNNTRQQVNANFLDYYVIKGQEGRAQAEQRRWRVNLVTRYQFSEGRLKGFSIGGSARWQDKFAAGYPLIDDPRGITIPDVNHPYFVGGQWNFDLSFGYRRKIFRELDWTTQLNFRNVQNWTSDAVSVVRYQPDGTVARARFDPPLQALLTNTVRF